MLFVCTCQIIVVTLRQVFNPLHGLQASLRAVVSEQSKVGGNYKHIKIMKKVFLLMLALCASFSLLRAQISMANDFPQDQQEEVFVVVEQMPEFPGGQAELFRFLSENVKYPVIAMENRIEGRVICTFIVDKDGSVVDVEVARSSGDASLDKEAVRVLRSMPDWIPGKMRGEVVRVKYTLPINFHIPAPDPKLNLVK